jgi:hypothetical protein
VPRSRNAWLPCYSESTNTTLNPFHQLTQRILYSTSAPGEDYQRGASPLTDVEDLEEKIALDIPEDTGLTLISTSWGDKCLLTPPSTPNPLPSPPSTPFPPRRLTSFALPAPHCIRTSYNPNRPKNRKYPIKSEGDYEWTLVERSRASQHQPSANLDDLKLKVS